MSKENPWFKFEPAEWMFGRIQRQPDNIKITFLDLVCKYWHRQCDMTIEDAELDFGVDNIKILIDNKIIESIDDCVAIDFLDSQMDNIEKTSTQNSKNGKKSAEARRIKKEKERETNDRSTTLERNSTDKKREDETIQDKINNNREYPAVPESDHLKDFDDFWNVYSKRNDKSKCITKWKHIKQKDRDRIRETLPNYIKATPEVKYRKNPLTYLNGECWNDVMEEATNPHKLTTKW